MSFASDMAKFRAKTEDRTEAIIDGLIQGVFDSVVHGSPVTGAPGQPVGAPGDPHRGLLRDSWEIDRVSPSAAVITTSLFYAPTIEDGVGFGGQTLANPSHTGGYHSVKLTIAGFEALGASVEASVE